MKLFYFNPNDYGQTAYVCAENKEEAINYLKKKVDKIIEDYNNKYDYEELKQHMIEFKQQVLDNMINCKDKYTIDEYNVGDVILGEIS